MAFSVAKSTIRTVCFIKCHQNFRLRESLGLAIMLPKLCKHALDRLIGLRIPKNAPLARQNLKEATKALIDAGAEFVARLAEKGLEEPLIERANKYRELTGPGSELDRGKLEVIFNLERPGFFDAE